MADQGFRLRVLLAGMLVGEFAQLHDVLGAGKHCPALGDGLPQGVEAGFPRQTPQQLQDYLGQTLLVADGQFTGAFIFGPDKLIAHVKQAEENRRDGLHGNLLIGIIHYPVQKSMESGEAIGANLGRQFQQAGRKFLGVVDQG